MWDVLKDYPAARVRLEAIAVKRLEKYKKAPLEKGKFSGHDINHSLLKTKILVYKLPSLYTYHLWRVDRIICKCWHVESKVLMGFKAEFQTLT